MSYLRNANDGPAPVGILIGTAGTGKSYVINCIRKSVWHTVTPEEADAILRVAAPTGAAAFNISGVTLHQLLFLPVPLTENLRPLSGRALARLQLSLTGCRLLLIDEMSMIGQRFLGAIDTRLRQAFPDNADRLFGGIAVILLGDYAQLPPVGDVHILNSAGDTPLRQAGKAAFIQLTARVYKLQQVLRQTDERFIQLLKNIRDAQVTNEDHDLLLTRSKQRLTAEELHNFNDAVRLLPTRASVAQHNYTKLRDVSTPTLRIQAIHAGGRAAYQANADDAMGLHAVITLKTTAKVMLTQNLSTNHGLVNGASGYVVGSIPAFNEDDGLLFPSAIVVNFPSYAGPSWDIRNPTWLPIPPTSFSWSSPAGITFSRTQFPLTLCYAVTIHKCQGMTLHQAVLDIGTKEWASGLTYTAISRVTSLHGLMFDCEDSNSLSRRWWMNIGNNDRTHRLRRHLEDSNAL
eukprot:GHVR01035468.1.p1 GENE.GHVR01035468.1~~GHVR01035468.1.p1  ORF type:complete len:461 (+),score=35.46 GHVR01035468.1:69-1451(+)